MRKCHFGHLLRKDQRGIGLKYGWSNMRCVTSQQMQKQLAKNRILGLFKELGFVGVRSVLRNSDVWHDYAQMAKCGDLELAISLSNHGRIRIYIRSHNTDQCYLAQLVAMASGRLLRPIHNDTSKKSCDVLEVVETMDWRNLGASELAVLRRDIRVVANVWNSAVKVV